MSSEEKQTESASFFQELGSFMKPYSGKYAASVVVSILSVAAGLVAYGFVGIIAGEIFSANRNCEAVLVPAAAGCHLQGSSCVASERVHVDFP